MFKNVNIWLIGFIIFLALTVHYHSVRLVRTKNEFQEELDKLNIKLALLGINDVRVSELTDDMKKKLFNITFEAENAYQALKSHELDIKRIFEISSNITTSVEAIEGRMNDKDINSLPMKVRNFETQMQHILLMLSAAYGNSPEAEYGIYKTQLDPHGVADNIISNYPGRENYNRGGDKYIRIGRLDRNNTFRELLAVKDILQHIPKGAEILSAVLYLKQTISKNDPNCDNVTIHLYEVLKDWGEGSDLKREAQPGESTWNEAKSGEMPWNSPGLWPDSQDVRNPVVAAAPKIQKWTKDIWVPFYFTPQGLEHLQKIVDGQPNYGWLMKYEDESVNSMMTFFHSSESDRVEDRPYLLILFRKKPSSESPIRSL